VLQKALIEAMNPLNEWMKSLRSLLLLVVMMSMYMDEIKSCID
jgi:hypothetical protein